MQFFLIRAKTEEELEAQRQQRMEEAVRKELEKANKPKRPVAPKKTEWEVEMIKGIKNIKDSNDTLFVVIVRNVYDWVGARYKKCSTHILKTHS